MGDQHIDQSRVDSECQVAEDIVIQTACPLEIRKTVSIDAEIDNPVGSLAVATNWVGQFLLIPESRGENFPIQLFNGLIQSCRNTSRIPGIAIGVKQEQAFVNFLAQGQSPGFQS